MTRLIVQVKLNMVIETFIVGSENIADTCKTITYEIFTSLCSKINRDINIFDV